MGLEIDLDKIISVVVGLHNISRSYRIFRPVLGLSTDISICLIINCSLAAHW
jgi:hypothetical protein